MERIFQIAAVILGGFAAYFLWSNNGDAAFISAVFGAVAFFLSVRFQVKGRLQQREIERLEKEEAEEREFDEPRPYFGELAAADASTATANDEQRTGEKTL